MVGVMSVEKILEHVSDFDNVCNDNMFKEAEKFVNQMLAIHRYSLSDIFVDLLDLYICMYSMGKMEKEYHEIIKKYTPKEIEILTKLIGIILINYSKYVKSNVDYDLLGSVYEFITSKYKSSALGQFFTPIHITKLMGLCVGIHEIKDEYVFANEPTVGSGRCCISAYNLNKNIIFSTTDLDKICVKMCAINMHLYQMIGSEVLHGDSLSLKFWGGFRIGLDYPDVKQMFGNAWDNIPVEKQNELLEINKLPTMVIIPIKQEEIVVNTSYYYQNLKRECTVLMKFKNLFNIISDNKDIKCDEIQNIQEQQEKIQEVEIIKEVLQISENKEMVFEFKKPKKFEQQISLFDI